jgi:hypothetical protein
LEYGDDLIEGVLAHEFLHVVKDTLDIARHAADHPEVSWQRPGEQDYLKSWSDYRQIDAEWQVDPGAWLSPRLQRLAALAEGEGSLVNAAIARMKSTWIDKNLPLEKLVMENEGQGITLDRAIVERAAQLAGGAADKEGL